MSDKVYRNFLKRWEEVVELPPQALGPLTPLYKIVTKRLKVSPFPFLLLVSLLLILAIYIVVGPLVTSATSLLQKGF